jgi:FkbM family methyltransferase
MASTQPILHEKASKRLKRFVRRIVSVTGYEITRADKILKADTAAVYTSNYRRPIKTIFDVGANIGQSVITYHRLFPDAEIVSFEPVAANYEKLMEVVTKTPRARAFPYALGARPGPATIYVPLVTLSSTLLAAGAGHPPQPIIVETLDRMRDQLDIEFIDLIKIDIEGFELEAIRGAERTLNAARVGIVFAEAGLRDNNAFHTHFGRLYGALKSFGFQSFGLYDIKYWVGSPFGNALFIHESQIKRA